MTSERLFNSFIPPKKKLLYPPKKTNFWLRPCLWLSFCKCCEFTVKVARVLLLGIFLAFYMGKIQFCAALTEKYIMRNSHFGGWILVDAAPPLSGLSVYIRTHCFYEVDACGVGQWFSTFFGPWPPLPNPSTLTFPWPPWPSIKTK